MGQINWTDEALRWLKDIFEYIARLIIGKLLAGQFKVSTIEHRFFSIFLKSATGTKHRNETFAFCFMVITGSRTGTWKTAFRIAIPAQAGIHLTVSKRRIDSSLRRNGGI